MPELPKPLRILVALEALCPGGANGGIKPALREQFLWLGAQGEQPFEFTYLCQADVADEIRREWMRPNDRLVLVGKAEPDLAATEGCDIVYSAFGVTRWAHSGIPTVGMTPDLLHRDYPESLSAEERQHREAHFASAIANIDLFQVISDYTAARLQHHYGVEPERIVRTYLPVQSRLLPAQSELQTTSAAKADWPAPYFFYPANAWPHKNHKTLLVAYALYRQLAEQSGERPWKLILTGTEDAAMQALPPLVQTLCTDEHVEFRGFVDEVTLAQLWAQAGVLVFPSLHEGFGIPLLEAMQQGVPILAHNATAIPEVAGNAAHLVDARAPERLANGLHQIASDSTLRASLIKNGRARLSQFSLADDFGPLIPAFRALLNSPSRVKYSGYYEDRLTAPVATFALPPHEAAKNAPPPVLRYRAEPLGIPRSVTVYADKKLISTLEIPAQEPSSGQIPLPPKAAAITLRTTNASRVSEADTRTLGIRLTALEVHQPATGRTTDLLPATAL